MDFLHFDPQFCVLICTRCQYALVPGTTAAHLSSLHKDEVAKAEMKKCVALWKDKPIQPAQVIQQLDLPIDTQPIPNLALYHDGISCRLCPSGPTSVLRGVDALYVILEQHVRGRVVKSGNVLLRSRKGS
jgi:hypothetical protein